MNTGVPASGKVPQKGFPGGEEPPQKGSAFSVKVTLEDRGWAWKRGTALVT